MSNVLLSFPNRADSATITGGSWVTSLPLTNLQDRRLARVARSADASLTSTLFNCDLGTDLYLRVAALPKGNFSEAAKWRIRGSSDATFADASLTTHDSGWLDRYDTVIYPQNVLNYGDPGWWDGKLASVDYTLGYRVYPTHIINPVATARFWRIEIDDTTNSDGYVDVGRLHLGYAYEPTVNMRNGFSFGWTTTSTRTETDGGATYHNDRPRRRLMEFVLPQESADEALVRGFEILRQLGTSGQLFVVFDGADVAHLHRRAYLGTLKELSPLRFPYSTRADQAFAIEEEL